MINYPNVPYECHTEITLALISGKWKPLILWHLCRSSTKTLRFNEFRRLLPQITQKMLTQQLKTLEEDKILVRKTYNQMPPRVKYSLSDSGERLAPLLQLLAQWGEDHKNSFAEPDHEKSI
ncbi:helix-turn-helix domain-containing protein [Paenibacillus filicis]|uniref:Helix-turn-helix domain-containing protein n=1 Tax=Paenibacillus filicis TaxID=669464 RepID=A0ABU9DTN4_9BACL